MLAKQLRDDKVASQCKNMLAKQLRDDNVASQPLPSLHVQLIIQLQLYALPHTDLLH